MPEPEIPPADPVLTPTEMETSGLKPSVAAGLACVFSIIGGVVFLVIEKRNKFVRFWSMQAVLLGLVAFAAAILFAVAHFVLGHLPLIGGLMNAFLGLLHWSFQIAWLAVYIICIVKAFSNKEWEIPWLGKIARRLVAKIDRKNLPTA